MTPHRPTQAAAAALLHTLTVERPDAAYLYAETQLDRGAAPTTDQLTPARAVLYLLLALGLRLSVAALLLIAVALLAVGVALNLHGPHAGGCVLVGVGVALWWLCVGAVRTMGKRAR